MKLVDRTLNYFEDFRQEYTFSIRPELTVLTFFMFWLIFAGRESLGDILPNPINIFNHIGNVDSVIPALVSGYLAGLIATKTLRLSKKQYLWLGILSGTLVGLACNILIEVPFGMKLLDQYNVSDILDAVWGTTFCLIACYAIFKVRAKK